MINYKNFRSFFQFNLFVFAFSLSFSLSPSLPLSCSMMNKIIFLLDPSKKVKPQKRQNWFLKSQARSKEETRKMQNIRDELNHFIIFSLKFNFLVTLWFLVSTSIFVHVYSNYPYTYIFELHVHHDSLWFLLEHWS